MKTPGLAVGLFDSIKVFLRRRARTVASRPVYEVDDDEVSAGDMVLHVRSLLEATRRDKPRFILQIMQNQRSRRAMICLFLAVLELVKTQAVEILQADLFGEIALAKGRHFDDGAPIDSLEEEYK